MRKIYILKNHNNILGVYLFPPEDSHLLGGG